MEVTCDFHPWMKVYWLILDHPYAALTDKDGRFHIENMPDWRPRVPRLARAHRRYRTKVQGRCDGRKSSSSAADDCTGRQAKKSGRTAADRFMEIAGSVEVSRNAMRLANAPDGFSADKQHH